MFRKHFYFSFVMKQIIESVIYSYLKKPQLNFIIAFSSIVICLVPKAFGINDSYNVPGANDIFDKESMETYVLLLLLSASPSALDFVMDIFSGHFYNLQKDQEMKTALTITSLSYILVSIDILSKLQSEILLFHISPPGLNLSFEFLIWCLRLNTTASLMFAISVRNPDKYPVWKTCIVTLAASTYGFQRYLVTYDQVLFINVMYTTRMALVSYVHYIYCVWVYNLAILRKWTVNDYGIFFNLVVFTLLTTDFIKRICFKGAYSIVLNAERYSVERIIVDLIISKVFFTVIPGRIAEIEMIEYKDTTIETRKAFVRYISHELRTPLNTVFSGIKLAILQHHKLNGHEEVINSRERLEILQEISIACGVAVEILNEFLMFDKIEQDTLGINKQEVNVIEFMTSAIKMIFVQIREKKIRLVLVNYVANEDKLTQTAYDINTNKVEEGYYSISNSLNIERSLELAQNSTKNGCCIIATDNVVIDKHKLDQVMRNLLSNAIKFTPSGGKITIAIKFKPDTTTTAENITITSGSLVIEVTDTGAGISEVDQKKLFKEVVQFRPHELQGGGGSGLGLFITKGIVDLHGGSISVSSPGEGLGSTFTLKIPMERIENSSKSICSTMSMSTASESMKSVENFDNEYSLADNKTLSSSKLIHVINPPIFDVSLLRTKSTNMLSQQFSQYEDLLARKDNANPLLERTILQIKHHKHVAVNSSKKDSSFEDYDVSTSNVSDNIVMVQVTNRDKLETSMNKKSFSLLVVDDSGINRKMMCRILLADGHQVEEADDGIKAVEMFEQHSLTYYDAILMDSHMRQMHGPEAASILRSLGYSGIILGITGDTADKDLDNFRQHGASRVLMKPVDIDIINETFRELKLIK